MNVKESLIQAEKASKDTTLLVDRSECIINYLRDQDVTVTSLEEALAAGKAEWEKILREMPQISNKISPMMRAHGGKIRNDIVAYEAHTKQYLEKAQMRITSLRHYATKSIQILTLLRLLMSSRLK